MQKTLLKFAVFELVERIARFRLVQSACADILSVQSPGLQKALLQEADALEIFILEQRSTLNRLFAETAPARTEPGSSSRQASAGWDDAVVSLLQGAYERLCPPTRLLASLKKLDLQPETLLYLRDALPEAFIQSNAVGEQSVFLTAEGDTMPFPGLSAHLGSPAILLDTLSVLQRDNPLAWLGLTRNTVQHLLESAATSENLRQELGKNIRKKTSPVGLRANTEDILLDELLRHAVNLRLSGPAYYFYALSQAVLTQNQAFLTIIEPALFFGLNHQNFVHKSLVIMHEACERSRPPITDGDGGFQPWTDEALSFLFRATEKLIPSKWAFSEKNMERAVQLQGRFGQGVLLSASARYELSEVADKMSELQAGNGSASSLSIYEPLSMMTEAPHTPREIITAGWLHKIERGPIWLYSLLNEDPGQAFDRLLGLLDEQDTLLRKSIEVSEVHRVLLCSL